MRYRTVNIYDNRSVVEIRVESAGSCWRSIYNFRPETTLGLSVRISQSELGEGRRRLMKHGYVVGRIGEDGTRKGPIKLNKVVFHSGIKKK